MAERSDYTPAPPPDLRSMLWIASIAAHNARQSSSAHVSQSGDRATSSHMPAWGRNGSNRNDAYQASPFWNSSATQGPKDYTPSVWGYSSSTTGRVESPASIGDMNATMSRMVSTQNVQSSNETMSNNGWASQHVMANLLPYYNIAQFLRPSLQNTFQAPSALDASLSRHFTQTESNTSDNSVHNSTNLNIWGRNDQEETIDRSSSGGSCWQDGQSSASRSEVPDSAQNSCMRNSSTTTQQTANQFHEGNMQSDIPSYTNVLHGYSSNADRSTDQYGKELQLNFSKYNDQDSANYLQNATAHNSERDSVIKMNHFPAKRNLYANPKKEEPAFVNPCLPDSLGKTEKEHDMKPEVSGIKEDSSYNIAYPPACASEGENFDLQPSNGLIKKEELSRGQRTPLRKGKGSGVAGKPAAKSETPKAKCSKKESATPAKKVRSLGEMEDGGDMTNFMDKIPTAILEQNVEHYNEEELKILRRAASYLVDPYSPCDCPAGQENGPYYIHLGHGSSLAQIRSQFAARLSIQEEDIRMVRVRFSGIEGKSKEGCPLAKWILRRSNKNEKVLIVVKVRPGHRCQYSVIVASVLVYDAMPAIADQAYDNLTSLTKADLGSETERKCGSNNTKTCHCQGTDPDKEGQSFTYGCNRTIFNYSCCKYAHSDKINLRRFRISNKGNYQAEEEALESVMTRMADAAAHLHERLSPLCYRNMCFFSPVAGACRVGTRRSTDKRLRTNGTDGSSSDLSNGRDENGTSHETGGDVTDDKELFELPYAGVTTVLDYCAHAHKDTSNMIGGCTAIVTLTKPENRVAVPEDQQYHILPMYVPDIDNADLQNAVDTGGIDVLSSFHKKVILGKRKPSCKASQTLKAKVKRDGSDSVADCAGQEPPGLKQKLVKVKDSWEVVPVPNSDPSSQLSTYESDCEEAFANPMMGGVAFSLPHGSLLLEVAKHELHATTALKQPNRRHPSRIGIVFYQHMDLHYPNHSEAYCQRMSHEALLSRYQGWLRGEYVPTQSQVNTLRRAGYVFPKHVNTRPFKNRQPEDWMFFRLENAPADFVPGMLDKNGKFEPIKV